MKFELSEYHRNITDEDLLNDLQLVAQSLSKNSVTMEEYDEYGKYHSATVHRRFGSWFKALSSAGLEKNRSEFNIPNQKLFDNLADVWIKLERQPTHREMRAPLSKYGGNTYSRHFGSWMNALRTFIDYINNDGEANNSEKSIENKINKQSNSVGKKSQKRRTKKQISHRLRFSILLRDGFRCQSCGKSPLKSPGTELHVDHIVPWSKGGETIPENLQTKCKQCNLGKGNAFEQ